MRVVYWDGSSHIELDRHIRQSASSYEVWFALQDTVSASASSSNEYYLYYGNDTASAAPENYSNVYRFYDGFDGSTLSSQWSGHRDAFSVSNGALVIPGTGNLERIIHTDMLPNNSVREYSLRVTNPTAGQVYIHTLANNHANNDYSTGNRIVHDLAPRLIRENVPAFVWDHSNTSYDVFQDRFYENTETFYAGQTYQDIEHKTTDQPSHLNPGTFKINAQYSTYDVYVDYVLVRDYIGQANEPVVVMGDLEVNAVPEPVSILLLMSALTVLVRRSRN